MKLYSQVCYRYHKLLLHEKWYWIHLEYDTYL